MRKRRRLIEIFNLSFLDVISCGFGAIILLLVISKISEPRIVEQTGSDLRAMVKNLEQELQEVRSKTQSLNLELTMKQGQLSDQKEHLARLQNALTKVEGEFHLASSEREARRLVEDQLQSAKQELTEEMSQLLADYQRPREKAIIGGVPVDSQYIVFILDTSGSMQRFAWQHVRRKMQEVLDVHPRVRGIQVLNDMGDYMFSQYAGRWIPDTEARRRAILERLSTWAPFSNSSPVEGITSAIQRFASHDKKISLYVFGDDFSDGLMQEVIETVRRKNMSDGENRSRVRIHTVGFPVLLQYPGAKRNAARFAALMRKLAEENNGSFVGLIESR